jgi:hypothetical protein
MFGLFGKKPPQTLKSSITFDESHCHSAGLVTPVAYKIAKGTTDLRVVFPDFEAFWQTHINRNQALPNETLIALRDGNAIFAAAIVEGGEYHYHNGVGDDGTLTLNAANLMGMGTTAAFAGFSNGALAFGIYHLGTFRFEMVWATVYTD